MVLPRKDFFLEDEGVIEIEKIQIALLTEKSYFLMSGRVAGKGKTSQTAESFASRFTSMYDQLAEEMAIYLEFENLFDLFALSKALKHRSSPKKATLDLKYLLDQYSLPRHSISENLPGRPNVKQFEHRSKNQAAKVWIPF